MHEQRWPATRSAPQEREHGLAREFLTFQVGHEHYGVQIEKVREIRRWEPTTSIANSPAFVKGVINLRGAIVPIVDMRAKLRSGAPECGELTAVIVLEVAGALTGVAVDAVAEVVSLDAAAIRPPPDVALFSTHCILGFGTHEQRLLILLDIEKLLSGAQKALIDDVVH